MKATGIVRKIDELGRVVIPKEVRRTLKIRDGEPLEIYTDDSGSVILKKYSSVSAMEDLASDVAEALRSTGDVAVMISDRDRVVAVAGLPNTLIDRENGALLERCIRTGEPLGSSDLELPEDLLEDSSELESEMPFYAVPIPGAGGVHGALVVFGVRTSDELGTEAMIAARSGAAVLGRLAGA